MEHIKPITAIMLLLYILPLSPEWNKGIHYIAMLAFAVMAYNEYMEKRRILAVSFGLMVIVFQPYVKLPISIMTWNAIHVILALLLTIMWIKEIHK